MRALVRAWAWAAVASLLAAATCLPAATASPRTKAIAKRKAQQEQQLQLTVAPQLTFSLNRTDKGAEKANRQAKVLHGIADGHRTQQALAADRIDRIQQLLDAATADEAQLRAELVARLVAQYQDGANADLALLASSDSLTEALDRADTLQRLSQEDRNLAQQHADSVARLDEARRALELLRDHQGELATAVDDHAAELETQLVSARLAHEAELQAVDDSGKQAHGGTFRIYGGEQHPAPSLLLPMGGQLGGTYDGGTRTPARAASDEQINQILSDPRVDIYPAGRIDIATRQIDGRVIAGIEALAGRFNTVHVTMLKTGHSIFTSSGNVSEHSFGCAADIGSLSGIVIQPSTQGPGSITEQGVLFLDSLPGDLAPHQVISLYSYGGASLGMADHYDHIHLGYHC